jgi:hypothetical protein
MNDPHDHAPQTLSPADARALDALVGAGFEVGRVGADERARAEKIEGLLVLTTRPCERVDAALVDVTLARILSASRDSMAHVDASLTSDDAEALDALVNANFNPSRVAPSLRARAGVVDSMREVVTQTPAYHGDRAALVDRTFRAVMDERASAPIPIERGRPAGLFRLADVASVAAVLVLGGSALFPVLSSWNTRREKTACVANLGGVASAMGAYSSDYRGSLPVASASTAGERWWDVGQGASRSNSANLFALRKNGYASLDQLACIGNPHAAHTLPADAEDWQNLDQVSYSYYVMFASQRPNWQAPNLEGFLGQPSSTVVLTDASPVIRRALKGEPIYVQENSPNHDGTGQWAVHADGSAAWMQSPMNGQDNIWLPADTEEMLRDIEGQFRTGASGGTVAVLTREAAARQRAVRLNGTEAPASVEDSFVGP